MRRGAGRLGRRAALTMAATAAVLAATPRPAVARELREALEILEAEERAQADAAERARRDALLADAPRAPRRPSLGLALGLSLGVPVSSALLGGMALLTGDEVVGGLGALAIFGAATVGPSLGRFYYGQPLWGGLLSGARALAALVVLVDPYGFDGVTEAGQAAALAWFALAVGDVVALTVTRPGAPAPEAAWVVAPWLGADGAGGLALTAAWP